MVSAQQRVASKLEAKADSSRVAHIMKARKMRKNGSDARRFNKRRLYNANTINEVKAIEAKMPAKKENR